MPNRKRTSAARAIAIGVTVALLLQSINGFFAYRAAVDYVEASNTRRQSNQFVQNSEELLSLLKDAETGQRGFLLTGDESYLEPYRAALRGQGLARQNLRRAAAGKFGDELDEIDALMQRLFNLLGEMVELPNLDSTGGIAAAQAVFRSGESKRLMDSLRDKIDAVQARQRDELTAATEKMDRLTRDTPLRVLLVSSLAVVLVGVTGWIAYRDVRRREIAEAQVREQRRILDSVLDNISDGVLFADVSGRLRLVNNAAKRLHGQDGSAIRQDGWSEGFGLYQVDRKTLIPVEDLPLSRALRGERVDQAELYLLPPHSSEGVYLGVSGRPIIDEHDEIQGGVIVMRDITRQKQAALREQEIRQELEEMVSARTYELNQSNLELQHKNQENETFVYSVSHDLRSPLVNLQGFSQELSLSVEELRRLFNEADVPAAVRSRGLTVLDDDIAGSIRFIQSAVMRLAGIINALLKLSRAGRVEYQLQMVAVDQIVRRIADALRSELTKHEATIEVAPLPEAWGDPLAVEQIFANLLENAVKYLDPSRPGRIEVGVVREPAAPEQVTYFVRDNGLGLPEAGREKIFKAFERFHPHHAPGDGMGLAIVRRIVDRHGGTIRFESTWGSGSVFFVTLPTGKPGTEPDEDDSAADAFGTPPPITK